MEWIRTVQEAVALLKDYVYLQALVIALVALVLAKLAEWLILRSLARLTRRTRSDVDDRLIELLQRPLFYSIFLAGLGMALRVVKLPEPFAFLCTGLLTTAVVLIWTAFAVRFAGLMLGWMGRRPKRFPMVQPATFPLFDSAAKLVLIGIALYFVLLSWQVNVSGWIASAGIIGLAVGLAAQETLANLFAGLSILTDAPYKVGDTIVLEGGERGEVVKIGLRSTRILTRDDIEVTVPNSMIANSKILNETGGPSVQRLRIPFGVAYGSDVDQVKHVIEGMARTDPQLCRDPQPWVQFSGFGDSSLHFELRCWIDRPDRRGRVIDGLNTQIYKTLRREGIEIPFPKRDLYVKQLPPSAPDQEPTPKD